jgi:hypothetical protein
VEKNVNGGVLLVLFVNLLMEDFCIQVQDLFLLKIVLMQLNIQLECSCDKEQMGSGGAINFALHFIVNCSFSDCS